MSAAGPRRLLRSLRRGWYSRQRVGAVQRVARSSIMRADRLVRDRAHGRGQQGQLSGIMFWAALIGICGAFTGVGFRASVRLVQRALTGHSTGLVETAELLPWWARIAVPTSAVPALARCCGWRDASLRYAPQRSTTWRPWPSAMASSAAARRLLQAASSFFTIGSGGSIGREGPLVQLAATVASKIGQWTQAPVPRLRLLVACGAAAGIAAAYNAPIAGALFVAEVVLGSIAMESFGPLIVASVVSDATSRHFLGYGPVYQVPHINFGAPWELALYACSACCSDTWRPPIWRCWIARARPVPPPALESALDAGAGRTDRRRDLRVECRASGATASASSTTCSTTRFRSSCWRWCWWRSWSARRATVGSGAAGRYPDSDAVHGRRHGRAVRRRLHLVDPALRGSQLAAYAVVGMGGFLAATTHAPLTSILLIFEMTLDYEVVLPLMLACVTGHYVARIYRRGESVYTRSLSCQGPGR